MILTRCPKCKNTVPIAHSFSPDLMVQCMFCNYKDWASSFAQLEGPIQTTSEQAIKNAWKAISSNLDMRKVEVDLNGYIDGLSEYYDLPSSTVVELINMSLRLKESDRKTTPFSFSVLQGEDVFLHELLEGKDDYLSDKNRKCFVIDASTIELELFRLKMKKLFDDKEKLEASYEKMQKRVDDLIERLSKYESWIRNE